jgi:predicted  nucleic acid-binding Zn-ribbon protein
MDGGDTVSDDTNASIARLEEQNKTLYRELNELKDSIKELSKSISLLRSKPGERWEKIVDLLFRLAILTGGGYYLTKILEGLT